MGLANRSTPAFLMAPVALWALPGAMRGRDSRPDEIRGGIFYDKHRGENGILASPEVLSSQLPFYNGSNPFLAAFLKPRLVAGAMVSVEGRISYAYTGVNWRVPIYDRLFAEVEFGGALNDSEKGQPGWLGCPVTFREIRRVGVPDNLQYRHRREHRARLSRRPVRPDKSRPEQLRIAARIRVLSWRRRRRRALLVRLRLLRRQFVEVLENQIDVGGDLNRDYSFESGVQFG